MIKILAREIGVGIHVVLGVLRAEFTEFDLLGRLTKGKLKGDLTAVYSYCVGENWAKLISEVYNGKIKGRRDRLGQGSCNLVKNQIKPTNQPKDQQAKIKQNQTNNKNTHKKPQTTKNPNTKPKITTRVFKHRKESRETEIFIIGDAQKSARQSPQTPCCH